jgi:DNA invertase Pin-like site-specific DNA recombinase
MGLNTLSSVATWKREIMLERQREGIAKVKAEGKYKGRKPTVAVQVEHIRAMRAAGEKPAHIAKRLGVARSSVGRMLEGVVGASGGLPGGVAMVAAG